MWLGVSHGFCHCSAELRDISVGKTGNPEKAKEQNVSSVQEKQEILL